MIGYARVSMGREETISVEIQEAALTRWARENGRRIVYWVTDPDNSGRNFLRKVTQAIKGISDGDASEIGIWRYDRWGRNTAESLTNIKLVERAGGRLISVTEPFDPRTGVGKYGRTNALAIAELQSDNISDGWKAAHASRVNRRLPASGTPRFGYVRRGRVRDPVRAHVYHPDVDDPAGERYEPDPETGPVLKDMYERYAHHGEGPRSVARWLNTEGILTTRGCRWSHASVMQVLSSGFGAGLLRIHNPACGCGGWTDTCPDAVYCPGCQDPVISTETWEAFLARKKARSADPAGAREPAYFLTGLLRCGTCGYRLTSTCNYGVRGWGYRCPRRGEMGDCATGVFVRRTVAEDAALEWLSTIVADIEEQAAVEAKRVKTARRAGSQRARLEAREAALLRKLARMVTQQAADESTPAEVYQQARAGVVADLEDVRARLRDATQAQAASSAEYLPVVVGLIEEWPTFPVARRRELLGHVIAEIRVHHTGFRKPARIQIVPTWEAKSR